VVCPVSWGVTQSHGPFTTTGITTDNTWDLTLTRTIPSVAFGEATLEVFIEVSNYGRRAGVAQKLLLYRGSRRSFQVGDTIRVRLRLVSPEPVFSTSDTRSQWWFYPPGQPEEIAPPRFPFEGITLL
jgi:hypothetical protein